MGLNIANRVLNHPWMVKATKPGVSSAVALVTTVSTASKDAVNCIYYVYQSLNNERIPEDKRKFVAALDLSNGILNVLTQCFLGAAMAKFTDMIFEKTVVPKHFSEAGVKMWYQKLKSTQSLAEFSEKMLKGKRVAKLGLAAISALVGTQIIAKRVIVPFIATPLASVFKGYMEKHDKKTSFKGDTVTISKDNKQANDSNKKNLPKCFEAFMR